MADTINSDDLTKSLVDACATYTDDVKRKIEKGIRKIARETKPEVISKSPTGKVSLVRGYKHYKDSWTTTTKKQNGIFKITVHNKKYQLIHLLELGHLNRDGTTHSQKFVHAETAQTHAEEKLDKLLEDL
ncbi:MAG: HK97 gp10 family phage protein [Ruminococcus sp.]|nr:HK97 gp10 family phage protein [Ruminococcus sp.]